jgi:cytosine/uracil/thiamine/allantoin permease
MMYIKLLVLSVPVCRFKMVRVVFKKERAVCPGLLSDTLTTVATMLSNHNDFSNVASTTKQLVQQIITGVCCFMVTSSVKYRQLIFDNILVSCFTYLK